MSLILQEDLWHYLRLKEHVLDAEKALAIRVAYLDLWERKLAVELVQGATVEPGPLTMAAEVSDEPGGDTWQLAKLVLPKELVDHVESAMPRVKMTRVIVEESST